MKIGIPKSLLYYKYHPFIETFFYELGAELITSEDTNKTILDEGVRYCVDDACLPIKIFHGHVATLKDKCDLIVVPRIMQVREGEFICPKFCGLPEMIKYSIPNIPQITESPIYANTKEKLYKWANKEGSKITKRIGLIEKAFLYALERQKNFSPSANSAGNGLKIALAGHPYNIYDKYVNMNLIEKLTKFNAQVITEEYIDEKIINNEIKNLYKRPFWTFARKSYGFATYAALNNKVDGIIYISSFACGIDSVVIDLIKHRIGDDFPMLILKIDEHTGEAGIDTRLEAFIDMLERSSCNENYFSASR